MYPDAMPGRSWRWASGGRRFHRQVQAGPVGQTLIGFQGRIPVGGIGGRRYPEDNSPGQLLAADGFPCLAGVCRHGKSPLWLGGFKRGSAASHYCQFRKSNPQDYALRIKLAEAGKQPPSQGTGYARICQKANHGIGISFIASWSSQ